METTLRAPLRETPASTGWAIAAGIGLIIGGFVALIAPLAGAIAAVAIFAWASIFGGSVELAHAWETRHEKHALWRFVIGALYVITGVFVLMRPVAGIAGLALALGVFLVARGVLMQFIAYQLRQTHLWGWFVFDGLVSALLGVLVLAAWPASSVIFLGIYVGAGMLVNGATRLAVVAATRSHEKRLPPAPTTTTGTPAHA